MVADKVVDYAKAGKRIKLARIERDWSQEDLAAHADVSVTFLSNVENAHSKGSLATFVKIANALGKGVDDIICDSITVCRDELNSELSAVTKDCADLSENSDKVKYPMSFNILLTPHKCSKINKISE